MVGFARESPQWSTAISDAILALSAFVGAEYLWQQRQRCSGGKGSRVFTARRDPGVLTSVSKCIHLAVGTILL